MTVHCVKLGGRDRRGPGWAAASSSDHGVHPTGGGGRHAADAAMQSAMSSGELPAQGAEWGRQERVRRSGIALATMTAPSRSLPSPAVLPLPHAVVATAALRGGGLRWNHCRLRTGKDVGVVWAGAWCKIVRIKSSLASQGITAHASLQRGGVQGDARAHHVPGSGPDAPKTGPGDAPDGGCT